MGRRPWSIDVYKGLYRWCLGFFGKTAWKNCWGNPTKRRRGLVVVVSVDVVVVFFFFFSGKIFRTASNRRQKGCWKKTYQSFGALAFESWHEQKWWCSFHFHFGVRKSGSIGISFPEDLRTLPMFRIHIRCRSRYGIYHEQKQAQCMEEKYVLVCFCVLPPRCCFLIGGFDLLLLCLRPYKAHQKGSVL